jgi:WhiB family transcriptional regulator, redox-sensing transcriptional regulator
VIHPLAWTAMAACRDTDPELFFPVGSEPVAQEARDACDACVVRPQCLEYALEERHRGVWGGTTDADRAAIRRQRQRKALKEAVA